MLYFKQNSGISNEVIIARQMSIVIKATEDVTNGRSSLAYINIPVAGDDHNPAMDEQYSSQIIKDEASGDFSLSPPIELVVTDEDTFPVDSDYDFTLKGDQFTGRQEAINKMSVLFFLGVGNEFFDVNKDTSDNKKATIVLKDPFDFDELPAQAGQLSFFVEVRN